MQEMEEDVRKDGEDSASSVREPGVNKGILERNKGVNKRVLNSALALGLIGGLVGDSGSDFNVGEDREKEADNKLPVTELYNQDISKEEKSEEFTFLPSSVGSGLDSEGFAKEEGDEEKVKQLGEYIDISIVNTLDIKNWDMYELASIENIEPKKYLPRIVSYIYYDENGKGGVLSPSLYVIPTQKGGVEIDKELPVLRYILSPALFRPLEIAKIYKVVTPKGDEILFGAPKESEGEAFNGKFLALMEINTSEGETVEFMNPEISHEETLSLQ